MGDPAVRAGRGGKVAGQTIRGCGRNVPMQGAAIGRRWGPPRMRGLRPRSQGWAGWSTRDARCNGSAAATVGTWWQGAFDGRAPPDYARSLPLVGASAVQPIETVRGARPGNLALACTASPSTWQRDGGVPVPAGSAATGRRPCVHTVSSSVPAACASGVRAASMVRAVAVTRSAAARTTLSSPWAQAAM